MVPKGDIVLGARHVQKSWMGEGREEEAGRGVEHRRSWTIRKDRGRGGSPEGGHRVEYEAYAERLDGRGKIRRSRTRRREAENPDCQNGRCWETRPLSGVVASDQLKVVLKLQVRPSRCHLVSDVDRCI